MRLSIPDFGKIFSEERYSHFVDLFDDKEDDYSVANIDIDDLSDIDAQPINAKTLTLTELQYECAKRGIRFSGFADDFKVLQEAFDSEHEHYIETKQQESIRRRQEQLKLAKSRARTRKMNESIDEELGIIRNDYSLSVFFKSLAQNDNLSACRIEPLDHIGGRILAKALWNNTQVKHLDLSGLLLSDETGAFICRAMKNNRSVVKLDLGENKLGMKSIVEISFALRVNTSLQFLNLASNNFDVNKDEKYLTFVEMFSDALQVNSTLRYVGLWNCALGTRAGQVLLKGYSQNQFITCIETGYNGFTSDQEKSFGAKMKENLRQFEELLERENIRDRENEKCREKEIEKEKEKEEIRKRKEWIIMQRIERAQKRMEKMEEDWKLREEEQINQVCLLVAKTNVNEKPSKHLKKKGSKRKKKKK